MRSKKRLVYGTATVVAMAIFVPFQSHVWSLYAGACAGYTILVFGLRRINGGGQTASAKIAKPTSAILRTHMTFLAIVVGWVWLCMVLKPYLPYILRTEDTSHPYFGLGFLGVLGLMFIELIEQRFLRPDPEMDAFISASNSPSDQ